jgi:hypothetical protein
MPRLIPTLMLAALAANTAAHAQHMNDKDSLCVNTVVTVDPSPLDPVSGFQLYGRARSVRGTTVLVKTRRSHNQPYIAS